MNLQQPATSHQRKVIIIGATSGIGKELALLYASKNYIVGVSGRRNDLLLALQEKFPENIIPECFDVSGEKNIMYLQNLIEKLDGLDILIYSSGYGEISEHADWNIDKQTIEVNVQGFTGIACYAFNYMARQRSGQIACISSVASIRGNADAPAYNASKAYQSNYMEGIYLKAKKSVLNVSVTDVQPGFVDTAMAKGAGKFWVATPQKAARQIYTAIKNKKKVVYISKRWWLIAVLLKYLPDFVYRKIA